MSAARLPEGTPAGRRAGPSRWAGALAAQGAVRPTAAGWSLLALVLVLVLMAVNEANNLLYALAFVLLSVWLVGAVQAWGNLRGLALRADAAPPVHAGEIGAVILQVEAGRRPRHAVELLPSGGGCGEPVPVDVPPGRPVRLALAWRAGPRGWQHLSHLWVRSHYPLGLAVARRRLPLSARRLVWPRPAAADDQASRASPACRAEAADQFTGLSPWRPGDSPRRLAWKAMARAGTPMVKRFDGADGQAGTTIDWRDAQGDVEQRLAVLARRVLDAESRKRPWRLVMPGAQALPAGPGAQALHRAFAAMALYGMQDKGARADDSGAGA